jgi:hypothetical protein
MWVLREAGAIRHPIEEMGIGILKLEIRVSRRIGPQVCRKCLVGEREGDEGYLDKYQAG